MPPSAAPGNDEDGSFGHPASRDARGPDRRIFEAQATIDAVAPYMLLNVQEARSEPRCSDRTICYYSRGRGKV
jgi:hypothetical protein